MPCTGTTNENSPRVVSKSPQIIANLFNKYFASIFINSCLQFDNPHDSDCDPLLSEVKLAENQIIIPARLLRNSDSVTAPSPCELFNKSLITGNFSSQNPYYGNSINFQLVFSIESKINFMKK